MQGAGTGIFSPEIGLWTYNMTTDAMPDPTPITGNLNVQGAVALAWPLKVGGEDVAELSIEGDADLVMRWSNPTRFALQTTTAPKLTLLGGVASVDLGQLTGSTFTASNLFFVEHYSDADWNVYLGAKFSAQLSSVLAALEGPFAAVLTDMVQASAAIEVDLNVSAQAAKGCASLVSRCAVRSLTTFACCAAGARRCTLTRTAPACGCGSRARWTWAARSSAPSRRSGPTCPPASPPAWACAS